MKSYRKELWFNIPARRGFVNITAQVEAALGESGVQEGLVLVNAMHITASVFINDDEPGLHHDYEDWLDFGTWEQIFYGEFDGGRRKRVLIKVIGE